MASCQAADLIKGTRIKQGLKFRGSYELSANLFMYYIYLHICNFKPRFPIEGKTCTVFVSESGLFHLT